MPCYKKLCFCDEYLSQTKRGTSLLLLGWSWLTTISLLWSIIKWVVKVKKHSEYSWLYLYLVYTVTFVETLVDKKYNEMLLYINKDTHLSRNSDSVFLTWKWKMFVKIFRVSFLLWITFWLSTKNHGSYIYYSKIES